MKNTQKGFIGIAIIILIAFAVAGGGAYVYTSQKARVDITNPEEQNSLKEVSPYAKLCGSDLECLKAAEEKQRTFTVYFKDNAQESEIISLKTKIESQNGIDSINYTSSNQGLEDFKERHKDDQLVIDALGTVEGNPVAAKMEIKIKDYKKRDLIIDYIKSMDTTLIVAKIM